MNKKSKILGLTVALAVIASIVMVSVPAEEEKIDETDCGCGCNEAPTEGKPLNFYDILEKMEGWEEDVALLEKEIQGERGKILELYKHVQKLGDKLSEINSLINWETFHPIVKGLYDNNTEKGRRPNIDEVVRIKLLILQSWYGLTDQEREKTERGGRNYSAS